MSFFNLMPWDIVRATVFDVVIFLTTFTVISSVVAYSCVASAVVATLAASAPEGRRAFALSLVPTILRCLSIPLLLLGYCFMDRPAIMVSFVLFLASLISFGGRVTSLNPRVEAPLLIVTVVALCSLGLVRSCF